IEHQATSRFKNYWKALVRPAKKIYIGQKLQFNVAVTAHVIKKGAYGEIELDFDCAYSDLIQMMEQEGQMALPPYIGKRSLEQISDDRIDYQTVFAKHIGAVAAPTAGLHFTHEMIDKIKQKGVIWHEVTLHVGAGTFRPIRVEDINLHQMHAEYGEISQETIDAIYQARQRNSRIIALGTTSLRILEAVARMREGLSRPFKGQVNLFIKPGFEFKLVDLLITNFHLPRSSLFILVCAFSGIAKMKRSYKYAIEKKYRFYSYGDACLLKLKQSSMTHT
ncbi:MAG: tRNA preQ1(34) S-adenosylmethionine ribosyltransferase-isomerase QueA, partial [Pseudomonadota bacterium]